MLNIRCLVLLLATAAQGSDVITCDASSLPVTEGDDVNITCYFPYDVSQMALISVSVDHYRYNSSIAYLPDRLVDCMKFDTPEFTCSSKVGCTIVGDIKKSLTFKISTVSAKHNGGFLCQVMPSEGQVPDTDFCFLSIRHASDVLTTTETTETATSTVRVDHESHAEKETTNTGLIAVVVISIILTVAAVVSAVIIFILWRRSVNKRKEREGTTDSVAAPPDVESQGSSLLPSTDGHTNVTTDNEGFLSTPITSSPAETPTSRRYTDTYQNSASYSHTDHSIVTPPDDVATPPEADRDKNDDNNNSFDPNQSS